MADDGSREARTYRIPPIEIYEVTDDELALIEESCRSLGQDLSFAIASLSICASFVIALSSSSPSGTVRTVYILVVVVTFVVFRLHRVALAEGQAALAGHNPEDPESQGRSGIR